MGYLYLCCSSELPQNCKHRHVLCEYEVGRLEGARPGYAILPETDVGSRGTYCEKGG